MKLLSVDVSTFYYQNSKQVKKDPVKKKSKFYQNSKHVKRDPVKKKSKLVQVVSVQQKVTSPLKREGKKVTQRRKAGGIAQHGQLKCTLKRGYISTFFFCYKTNGLATGHYSLFGLTSPFPCRVNSTFYSIAFNCVIAL